MTGGRGIFLADSRRHTYKWALTNRSIRRLGSVVEQRFCKPQVTRSNRVGGSKFKNPATLNKIRACGVFHYMVYLVTNIKKSTILYQ